MKKTTKKVTCSNFGRGEQATIQWYRYFFYTLIIAKNIYSIKYIKKNRRAGKQLEKVLKNEC